jgi:hypothetical protein
MAFALRVRWNVACTKRCTSSKHRRPFEKGGEVAPPPAIDVDVSGREQQALRVVITLGTERLAIDGTHRTEERTWPTR